MKRLWVCAVAALLLSSSPIAAVHADEGDGERRGRPGARDRGDAGAEDGERRRFGPRDGERERGPRDGERGPGGPARDGMQRGGRGPGGPGGQGRAGGGPGGMDAGQMVQMAMGRFDKDGDQKLDSEELQAFVEVVQQRMMAMAMGGAQGGGRGAGFGRPDFGRGGDGPPSRDGFRPGQQRDGEGRPQFGGDREAMRERFMRERGGRGGRGGEVDAPGGAKPKRPPADADA